MCLCQEGEHQVTSSRVVFFPYWKWELNLVLSRKVPVYALCVMQKIIPLEETSAWPYLPTDHRIITES